jgi:hypothetical protein
LVKNLANPDYMKILLNGKPNFRSPDIEPLTC